MLNGEVEHGDSIGNRGVIRSGDLQWMTAGSGIIHQEMPKRYDGVMHACSRHCGGKGFRVSVGSDYAEHEDCGLKE